jgi:hypothetical protein
MEVYPDTAKARSHGEALHANTGEGDHSTRQAKREEQHLRSNIPAAARLCGSRQLHPALTPTPAKRGRCSLDGEKQWRGYPHIQEPGTNPQAAGKTRAIRKARNA